MRIRRATSADADAVLHCLRTAFEPYESRYTPEGFADTVLTSRSVSRRLDDMTVLVATTSDDEVVGTIGLAHPNRAEGHLRGMAVLPSWHGRGVGEQLLTAAEAELRGLGCVRVTLDTTEPLERAMRFYEKHGFARSGRVADFYGMRLIEYVKEL